MELLVGIILPPIIEVLNKDIQTDEEKFLIAVLLCLIVAVLIKLPDILNGNIGSTVSIFLVIFGESVTVFNLYWKNSFPRDWLQEKLGVTQ